MRLMLVSLAGWINQQQEHVIDYLLNRKAIVLKPPFGITRCTQHLEKARAIEQSIALAHAGKFSVSTPIPLLRMLDHTRPSERLVQRGG